MLAQFKHEFFFSAGRPKRPDDRVPGSTLQLFKFNASCLQHATAVAYLGGSRGVGSRLRLHLTTKKVLNEYNESLI